MLFCCWFSVLLWSIVFTLSLKSELLYPLSTSGQALIHLETAPTSNSFSVRVWYTGHSTTKQSVPDTLICQIFMKIGPWGTFRLWRRLYNFRPFRAKLLSYRENTFVRPCSSAVGRALDITREAYSCMWEVPGSSPGASPTISSRLGWCALCSLWQRPYYCQVTSVSGRAFWSAAQ